MKNYNEIFKTVRKLNEKWQRYRCQRESWGPLSSPFIVSHDRVTSGRFTMSGQRDSVVYALLNAKWAGAGGTRVAVPAIAVPAIETPLPRNHKRVSMYMVGAFLRRGYVTVPRCWPCKVSPLLLHLIESLSLSHFLCLSWFISLPPSPLYEAFFTACWSPHSDLSSARTPSDLSLKSFSLSLSLFPLVLLPLPRAPDLFPSFIRTTHSLQTSSRLQASWHSRILVVSS